mmetsp:Transcript_28882/g.37952  ORF Transcript_28882/g.37952 Transcript_28882/m.37952 type:complete len:84 (+) Transcript_28882:240-491(+)
MRVKKTECYFQHKTNNGSLFPFWKRKKGKLKASTTSHKSCFRFNKFFNSNTLPLYKMDQEQERKVFINDRRMNASKLHKSLVK